MMKVAGELEKMVTDFFLTTKKQKKIPPKNANVHFMWK